MRQRDLEGFAANLTAGHVMICDRLLGAEFKSDVSLSCAGGIWFGATTILPISTG